jgi:uncharacterized protein YbjT (DUF2867 family)
VARGLSREGFRVAPIARSFTQAQRTTFGTTAIECPFVALGADVLDPIFTENKIDIVFNCVGVLQDGPRGSTHAVHHAFVDRLVTLLGSKNEPLLLIHLSIPGCSEDDQTLFSRTKRAAERVITAGSGPFVILRPGFVVAPAAYGGSAMMRALAVLPFDLPMREAGRAFAVTDVSDITRTIVVVARRWRDGERRWNAIWDVMARQSSTVGDVIDAFQRCLGGPERRMRLPSRLLGFAAAAGDLVAHFGWSPPMRTTALQEMRRGVTGDPGPWIAATGIQPASLDEMLRRLSSTVQERWFARLYLCKPLILATLAIFWALSGLIALAMSFSAATAILISHGLPPVPARLVTVMSSLVDVSIGSAIACRPTCRIGLLAGICISLCYMIGAAVVTPEMWIEPLGALVKTGPAIALMVVALAMLEDR